MWKWAEREITLTANYALPGPLSLSKSRYLRRVFDALQDPRYNEVTYRKGTQTGGTLVSDVWIAWVSRVRPAPYQVNMQTDADAQDHAEDRINPLLKSTPSFKPFINSADRHEIKTCEAQLQLMAFRIQSANKSNLQSKSVCYQVNDEVVFWGEAGLLGHADRRLTRFEWRRKQFNVSQGGAEDDEFDKKHKAGSRDEYVWPCPKCGFLQPFVWQYNNDHHEPGGMKFLDNEETHPDEEWNLDALAQSVYYECRKCRHQIRDTPTEREELDRLTQWRTTNSRAAANKWSGELPAMACLDIPWGELVIEWVEAVDAMRTGDIVPLENFIKKRLAQSFREDIQFFEVQKTENRDYQVSANTDLNPGKFWEDEHVRFMTIDRQLDHHWFVVRAWAEDGRSRLVDYGKLIGEEDLRSKQLALGVEDEHVACDSGFEATDVYMLCCVYGWRSLKGEDQKAFAWFNTATNTRIYRPYSKPTKQDPMFGMRTQDKGSGTVREFLKRRRRNFAILARWSNYEFNQLLQRLKTGRGLYWGIPANIRQVYLDQMNGAAMKRMRNKLTGRDEWRWVKVGRKGDHLRDCELMQLVCAAFAGLLMGRETTPMQEEVEDANNG